MGRPVRTVYPPAIRDCARDRPPCTPLPSASRHTHAAGEYSPITSGGRVRRLRGRDAAFASDTARIDSGSGHRTYQLDRCFRSRASCGRWPVDGPAEVVPWRRPSGAIRGVLRTPSTATLVVVNSRCVGLCVRPVGPGRRCLVVARDRRRGVDRGPCGGLSCREAQGGGPAAQASVRRSAWRRVAATQ